MSGYAEPLETGVSGPTEEEMSTYCERTFHEDDMGWILAEVFGDAAQHGENVFDYDLVSLMYSKMIGIVSEEAYGKYGLTYEEALEAETTGTIGVVAAMATVGDDIVVKAFVRETM